MTTGRSFLQRRLYIGRFWLSLHLNLKFNKCFISSMRVSVTCHSVVLESRNEIFLTTVLTKTYWNSSDEFHFNRSWHQIDGSSNSFDYWSFTGANEVRENQLIKKHSKGWTNQRNDQPNEPQNYLFASKK